VFAVFIPEGLLGRVEGVVFGFMACFTIGVGFCFVCFIFLR